MPAATPARIACCLVLQIQHSALASLEPHLQSYGFAGAGATIALVSSGAATPPAEAMEKMTIMPEQLSTFEKAGQRGELLTRAQAELRKVLSKEDAPKAMRCV